MNAQDNGTRQFRIGRFDAAPEFAPETEFPADAGAPGVIPEAKVIGRRVGGVLTGRAV